MHFHVVDLYQDTGSPLHHLDPRPKVVMAVLLILLVSLAPMGAFVAYAAFFAMVMLGALVAEFDPGKLVKRSLVALPFAAAAITLVFTVPGPSLGTVPLLGWRISGPGLVRFMSIMLKSMVSVQIAVLLTATTHFTDLLWALGALRVPKVLISIVSFMYRYIFVLADEALRLTRARDARSATLEGAPSQGGSIIFRARTTGGMIGSLFLRSYERSERVYQAMVARGYRGEIKQLDPPPLTLHAILVGGLPVLAGVVIVAMAFLRG